MAEMILYKGKGRAIHILEIMIFLVKPVQNGLRPTRLQTVILKLF